MMSGHEIDCDEAQSCIERAQEWIIKIDCDEALSCIERAQEWIIKMRRNPGGGPRKPNEADHGRRGLRNGLQADAGRGAIRVRSQPAGVTG